MAITKVLVVDDSITDLKNLEQIVSAGGYAVITAMSGKEAVEKTRSERPDAVLLDVIMPEMNGFQACRAITSDQATKDIPVILVSSKGEKTDKVWGAEQGARGYITKPFTSDQILNELRAL
ncbi:MAG: two-component system response regulator [Candidatus Muproteobacteria bacterium RBG_19FT_COMBO_61_10]|jgi:twitching motility two-component system response regulator PilH|uniref:Two-component system response regulator n=1 Tax=Candidatus Muproteobacteria bacterium RBG_19FT_COMBO_61_10 TaxID=1817761 RepID=A0A1F6UN66_9PROT|nr:MAG: two-component system response regulator [Candidatus Muproteobacteria bacterium RBG_19FT_COMBO_61_10]